MDNCFGCGSPLPAPDPVTGLTVCPGCGNTQNTIYNQGNNNQGNNNNNNIIKY